MADRDIKKLLNRIEALEKQNSKLKKELSKQKKYVSKATDLIIDNYDKCDNTDYYEKVEKAKFCEECGKGEVKTIKVLNFSFDVCPVCQYKKKIK
jgi:predicted RNase H-like nuclease (RuvC/YqgF family)